MQKIVPCLWFDGNAEEAVKFYSSAFNNVKTLNTANYLTETPSNKPVGSIMTIDFEINGYKFLALNGGPYFTPNPSISFTVNCKSVDEVEKIWNALSENSKVLMPLDKYPFSEKYGWIEDKYGFSWQIIYSTEIPNQTIIPSMLFVGSKCGKTEEAMNLYTSIFNDSEIGTIARYGADHAPDKEGTITYASFKLNNEWLSAMDSAYEHNFDFNEAVSLMIYCADQQEINYFYDKLSVVPEAEMCGWLKDKYGVSWQLVHESLDKMLAQKNGKKVMEALMEMKKIDLDELTRINNSNE